MILLAVILYMLSDESKCELRTADARDPLADDGLHRVLGARHLHLAAHWAARSAGISAMVRCSCVAWSNSSCPARSWPDARGDGARGWLLPPRYREPPRL